MIRTNKDLARNGLSARRKCANHVSCQVPQIYTYDLDGKLSSGDYLLGNSPLQSAVYTVCTRRLQCTCTLYICVYTIQYTYIISYIICMHQCLICPCGSLYIMVSGFDSSVNTTIAPRIPKMS